MVTSRRIKTGVLTPGWRGRDSKGGGEYLGGDSQNSAMNQVGQLINGIHFRKSMCSYMCVESRGVGKRPVIHMEEYRRKST